MRECNKEGEGMDSFSNFVAITSQANSGVLPQNFLFVTPSMHSPSFEALTSLPYPSLSTQYSSSIHSPSSFYFFRSRWCTVMRNKVLCNSSKWSNLGSKIFKGTAKYKFCTICSSLCENRFSTSWIHMSIMMSNYIWHIMITCQMQLLLLWHWEGKGFNCNITMS